MAQQTACIDCTVCTFVRLSKAELSPDGYWRAPRSQEVELLHLKAALSPPACFML